MNKGDKELLTRMYSSLKNSVYPENDLLEIQDELFSDEEESIGLDFDYYCSLIAGSFSYAAAGKKIPKHQRYLLKDSFFDTYPQYSVLKSKLDAYTDFNTELSKFEDARQTLLRITF